MTYLKLYSKASDFFRVCNLLVIFRTVQLYYNLNGLISERQLKLWVALWVECLQWRLLQSPVDGGLDANAFTFVSNTLWEYNVVDSTIMLTLSTFRPTLQYYQDHYSYRVSFKKGFYVYDGKVYVIYMGSIFTRIS